MSETNLEIYSNFNKISHSNDKFTGGNISDGKILPLNYSCHLTYDAVTDLDLLIYLLVKVKIATKQYRQNNKLSRITRLAK